MARDPGWAVCHGPTGLCIRRASGAPGCLTSDGSAKSRVVFGSERSRHTRRSTCCYGPGEVKFSSLVPFPRGSLKKKGESESKDQTFFFFFSVVVEVRGPLGLRETTPNLSNRGYCVNTNRLLFSFRPEIGRPPRAGPPRPSARHEDPWACVRVRTGRAGRRCGGPEPPRARAGSDVLVTAAGGPGPLLPALPREQTK